MWRGFWVLYFPAAHKSFVFFMELQICKHHWVIYMDFLNRKVTNYFRDPIEVLAHTHYLEVCWSSEGKTRTLSSNTSYLSHNNKFWIILVFLDGKDYSCPCNRDEKSLMEKKISSKNDRNKTHIFHQVCLC
jgi:hypothetical protein